MYQMCLKVHLLCSLVSSSGIQNGSTPVIPGGQVQPAPSHLSGTGGWIGIQNGSIPVIPGGQMQPAPSHLSGTEIEKILNQLQQHLSKICLNLYIKLDFLAVVESISWVI